MTYSDTKWWRKQHEYDAMELNKSTQKERLAKYQKIMSHIVVRDHMHVFCMHYSDLLLYSMLVSCLFSSNGMKE